jgi:hypothetical protein
MPTMAASGREFKSGGWIDGWIDGWMERWMDGKACLRIAYSNLNKRG